MTVTDCVFEDNIVSKNGGAIYAQGAEKLTIRRNFFNGNNAGAFDGRGGAIYAGPDVTLWVFLNIFDDNSASEGAAIACCGGTIHGVEIFSSVTSAVGTIISSCGCSVRLCAVSCKVFDIFADVETR